MSEPPPPRAIRSRASPKQIAAALIAIFLFVTLAYSNHFHNSFHFDDAYAIVQNSYVHDLHHVAQLFEDARTNDTLPANQTYRPLLELSFAIDYRLAGGLKPLWFHLSTFFWYLVMLTTLFLFYGKVFDTALPDPRNDAAALFATALYGLHPAMAETVNYIMQRADLYSTLAVVAGLTVYLYAPGLRRYGLYLIPVLIGLFAKQPTAVFPALLFAWIWLFEEEDFRKALVRSAPAFVATGAVALFVLKMNAATYNPGGSPYSYRISQPAVLMSYFRRFFLPVDLSADTDRRPYASVFDAGALYGFLFLLALCAAIYWFRKRRETRPIALGLFWFIVACAPTSWVALAEVENDHRLFFPFVGLTMSVCWFVALQLYRNPLPRFVTVGAGALILTLAALGTYQRNRVWHTEETLWYDVTRKSPGNGRGLMNYGLSQMEQGRYDTALDYFNRALVLNPYYSTLEINLGIVNGALHRNAEAERHFLRAIQLDPADPQAKTFYGRWLAENGRVPEAVADLNLAVQEQPDGTAARYLLMQLYAALGDREKLRAEANATLAFYPADATARSWLARAEAMNPAPAAATVATAEGYVNESLAFFQAGKYAESLAAARRAVALKPDYAPAWNNIMACYNAVSDWDRAIEAGEKAVSLDPSSQLARNNLQWARTHKEMAARIGSK